MTQPDAIENAINVGAFRPGEVFAEKFAIEELLGIGGMGAVYKARQLVMDRLVALKLMHPWLLTDGTAVHRFSREARIVSGLNHPNIVKLISFGVENQQPYMAFGFIEGQSLAEYMRQHTKVKPAQAADIALQAARGLSYAHRNGLLHRDIKPGNIMLLPQGHVQLVDFGVAKLLDVGSPSEQHLTKTNSVIGTPYYMSPEQCEKKPLDARSDMYALGCVLYEMLSGRPPFIGESTLAVMFSHIHEAPPALPADVPPWLESLTIRMLAKLPQDRLADMSAVEKAIEQSTAPQVVPRKKFPIRRHRYLVPILLALIATTSAGLIVLKPRLQEQARVADIRHRYSDEFEVAEAAHASSWEQAKILWNEANELGYPEGARAALLAAQKLDKHYRHSSGYGDYKFCKYLSAVLPVYISKFHDQSQIWRDLLMQACWQSFDIAHRLHLPGERADARVWMEAAQKYSNDYQYACSLSARIISREMSADQVRKLMPTAEAHILGAEGTTPETQMTLSALLIPISDAADTFDHKKGTEILRAAISGLDKQFGPNGLAAAHFRLRLACRFVAYGEETKEAKALVEQILPVLSKGTSRNDMDATIIAAEIMRDKFNSPGETTPQDALRYAEVISEKKKQILSVHK